jgi:hypothetical protein
MYDYQVLAGVLSYFIHGLFSSMEFFFYTAAISTSRTQRSDGMLLCFPISLNHIATAASTTGTSCLACPLQSI